MRNRVFSFLATVVLVTPITKGQGTTRYTGVPYGLENQSGNDGDIGFRGPTEYQLIFRGTYLAQAWTSPTLISQIAFRVENGFPDFNATIPRVEIRMSTTGIDPENIQPFWALNSGQDATIVFNRPNVALAAEGGAGVNPFQLAFRFDTPFVYNPQAGNLAIFLGTYGTGAFLGSSQVDAQEFDPPLSLSPVVRIGGVFASPHPSGLVTQFEWISVPEPSISGLSMFGLIVCLGVKRNQPISSPSERICL